MFLLKLHRNNKNILRQHGNCTSSFISINKKIKKKISHLIQIASDFSLVLQSFRIQTSAIRWASLCSYNLSLDERNEKCDIECKKVAPLLVRGQHSIRRGIERSTSLDRQNIFKCIYLTRTLGKFSRPTSFIHCA